MGDPMELEGANDPRLVGGQGEFRTGEDQERFVGWKMARKDDLVAQLGVYYEGRILEKVRSDHVVGFRGLKVVRVNGLSRFKLELELCVGSLDVLCRSTAVSTLDHSVKQEALLVIAYEILLGLDDLHSKDILHNDIKPGNILLFGGTRIQLGDLGLARHIHDGFQHDQRTLQGDVKEVKGTCGFGTEGYVAPETITNYRFSFYSDMHQLGKTIEEIHRLFGVGLDPEDAFGKLVLTWMAKDRELRGASKDGLANLGGMFPWLQKPGERLQRMAQCFASSMTHDFASSSSRKKLVARQKLMMKYSMFSEDLVRLDGARLSDKTNTKAFLDCYVPNSLRAEDSDKDSDIESLLNEHERLVVSTDAGYGKTTLAHYIGTLWSIGKLTKYEVVIVVDLKSIEAQLSSGEYISPFVLWKACVGEDSMEEFNEEFVNSWLSNKRVLYMMDSLDEISRVAHKHNLVKHLEFMFAWEKGTGSYDEGSITNLCILSRPYYNWNPQVIKSVKLIPYNDVQANSVIAKHFPNGNDEEARTKVSEVSGLSELCRIPLFLELACFGFSVLKDLPVGEFSLGRIIKAALVDKVLVNLYPSVEERNNIWDQLHRIARGRAGEGFVDVTTIPFMRNTSEFKHDLFQQFFRIPRTWFNGVNTIDEQKLRSWVGDKRFENILVVGMGFITSSSAVQTTLKWFGFLGSPHLESISYLPYTCLKFRNDRDVVWAATSVTGLDLQYASQRLRNDREVVLRAVKQNEKALEFASQELRNDRGFVLEAIKQKKSALAFAPQKLRNDREFVLEAIKENGEALEFAPQKLRNDRGFVLDAIKQNGEALEFAPQKLRNQRKFVLEAIKQNGSAFEFASQELQNDRNVVLEAVKQNGEALESASQELQNDRDVVLEAVKQSGRALRFASQELQNDRAVVLEAELQNDRDVVLEAVTQDGCALKYASQELQNDRDVVLEAVKQSGWALRFASQKLRKDRDVVLEAIKQDGWALEFATQEVRNDRDFVLEAIKQNGEALEFAPQKLRNYRGFVLEAIKQNGEALEFAPQKLQNKREFVLEAVKQNGRALIFASQELRNDREVVLEAVKQNGKTLKYASQKLRNDRDVVLEAVKQDGWALEFATQEVRNDRDFVLEAVKQNGKALKYATQELREDEDIVLEAVKQNGKALKYASQKLRNDRGFVLIAIKQNGVALEFAPQKLRNYRGFVLEAIKQNGEALEFASQELQNKREFVLEAVKQNGRALIFASQELRNDREVVLEAVKQNGWALKYATQELREDEDIVLEANKHM